MSDINKEGKPINKMSSKELQAECTDLREQATKQRAKIDSLNTIIDKMVKEHPVVEKLVENEKMEAARVRKSALDQANTIIEEAKAAAEKILECARQAVYEPKPFEVALPGSNSLDLSGLLDPTSQREEPDNPVAYAQEEQLEKADSKVEADKKQEDDNQNSSTIHQRILADYF